MVEKANNNQDMIFAKSRAWFQKTASKNEDCFYANVLIKCDTRSQRFGEMSSKYQDWNKMLLKTQRTTQKKYCETQTTLHIKPVVLKLFCSRPPLNL